MKRVYVSLTLGDIFIFPIPDVNKCHYFVLLASLQNERKCLLVSINSIKEGLYYDKSCIFDENDNICYKSGSPLIKQKSSIRYDMPIEVDDSYLIKIKNTSRFCGHLKSSLFQRLIDGAKKTSNMKKSLKIKYNLVDNNIPYKKKVVLKQKFVLQNQR